jgi:hypothetical protein
VSLRYSWTGGTEGWFRTGSSHSLQILLISPLFEEANRCRRLIAGVVRGLDAFGIGAVVPDLPGTGESLTDISDVRLVHWQDALKCACTALLAEGKPVAIASFRGGALLDGIEGTAGAWRFAPESGQRIVRDLRRTRLTSEADAALYAGHALSDGFLAELEMMELPSGANCRTVRLTSDRGDAALHVEGSPLWRRAEPGDDPALAASLARDLILWTKTCAG